MNYDYHLEYPHLEYLADEREGTKCSNLSPNML